MATKKLILKLLFFLNLLLVLVLLGETSKPLSFTSELSDTAHTTIQNCRKESWSNAINIDCVGKELAKIAGAEGFPAMNKILLRMQEAEPSLRNCHVLGHTISQILAKKKPDKWKELISHMDPGTCGGGLMHGVLEIRILNDSNFEINADVFNEICKKIFVGGFSTSCAHILGHITLVEKAGNLEEALAVCEGLEGEFLFECYGGIFMEDSFKTNFPFHGLGPEPVRNIQWFETQLERCRKHASVEKMEAGCFYDMAEVAAQAYEYEISPAYEVCAKVRYLDSKRRCYARASYIVATAPIPKIDRMNFAELCSHYRYPDPIEQKCIRDTVGALMSYSIAFVHRANSFCAARREEESRNACFQQLGNEIQSRIPSSADRKKFCLPIPDKYKPYCE